MKPRDHERLFYRAATSLSSSWAQSLQGLSPPQGQDSMTVMRFLLAYPSSLSMSLGIANRPLVQSSFLNVMSFNKCYEKTLSHLLWVIKNTLNRAGCRIEPCRSLLATGTQAKYQTLTMSPHFQTSS